MYNSLTTLPILSMDESQVTLLSDDQEYAQRQQVRQVMVAFKRYVEAHLAIKAGMYQRIAGR